MLPTTRAVRGLGQGESLAVCSASIRQCFIVLFAHIHMLKAFGSEHFFAFACGGDAQSWIPRIFPKVFQATLPGHGPFHCQRAG